MAEKTWKRENLDIGQRYQRGDEIFEVAGIFDAPTVVLKRVLPEQPGQVTLGIESAAFAEFHRLLPVKPE